MYHRPLKPNEYLVPVTYAMSGFVSVTASSPDEAWDKVKNDDGTCPLPHSPEYVEGSFEPSFDTPESVLTYTNDYNASRLNIELASEPWEGPVKKEE